MEEKKLTDEEIIRDLEEFERDIDINETGIYTEILNLIRRLQSENERLTKLQSHGAFRVTELCIENDKLQKQVGELKGRLWASENAVKEMSNAFGGEKTRADKSVKDTAKEILQMVECWEDKPYVSKEDFKESIKQLYGVEVE